MRHPSQAAALVTVAMIGQLLIYALSIVLARRLSAPAFEAYVVASAAFVMLATFAPRGSEKHALLALPPLLRRADLRQARALLAFGARRTALGAIAAMIVVGGWAALARDPSDETRAAIVVACLSLPAGALVHFGVEALTAAGRPVAALVLFRVVVPGVALALCAAILLSATGPVRGALPVAAWGFAWLVALALVAAALRRADLVPSGGRSPAAALATWRAEARPFLVYRMALVLLAQAAVVALDLLQASPIAVGAYAAALATAGIAAVLATATNRAYGKELSLLLEQRDFEAMLALRRARLRWLAPALAAFLAATLLYPAGILALFGPEFAREGAAALRLIAAATAFSVLFALAPTYLKYRRRNRVLYAVVAAAAATQLALLAALIPRFGATGAALAYAVSTVAMYAAFALLGHRELARLRGAR